MGTNIWKQRSHYGLLKSSPALPNMGFIFHAQRAPSQRYQPTKLLWKTRTATINGLFKTGAWEKGRIIVMCLSTFSYKYSFCQKLKCSAQMALSQTGLWCDQLFSTISLITALCYLVLPYHRIQSPVNYESSRQTILLNL